MNRPPKKTIAAALGGMFLTLASTAYAAGLGKLSVISSLGQPLSAEIDLVSLQPGEFEVLAARVASPKAYTDARIEYSPLLRQLRFSVERKIDGKPVLKITSGGAINEPFLDVLVELTWPSGRLVREYPILLDPPGFNESRIQIPVAAVQVERSEPRVATASPAPSGAALPSAVAESDPKTGTYGPVKRGDTLSKIATEMKGEGVSLDQMLVALFRENRQAFGNGNMNLLKTGQILRIPSAADVSKITKGEAQKEIRVQVADWKSYREQIARTAATAAAKPAASNVATGQVASAKPVPPPPAAATDQLKIAKAETSAQAGASGAKGGAEAAKTAAKEDAIAKEKTLAEAKARIAELEKQKADAQKLVQLKAAPAMPVADTKPPQVAQAPAAPVTPPAANPAAAPVAANPADAPKADAPKPAPPKVATKAPPPPPPEPELLDIVKDNLLVIAGVGGAGLLAVGGFLFVRRRKAGAVPNSSMMQTSSLMPSDLKLNSQAGAKKKAGGLVDTGNSSFLTDFDKAGPGAIDTDEVDPVAEAEVYIAYGRDEQAEAILKEAKLRDKGRHEISMKLLEIYHARKTAAASAAFEAVARELKEAIGENDPMWAKAASMGASIDPTNSLYSGAAQFESTNASAAVGSMNEATADAEQKPDLDFDLGFGDSATTQEPAATLDITLEATDQSAPAEANAALDFELDLGAGTSDVPTTAVDNPSEAGGLDFDLALDSPGEPAPATASSATAVPSSSGFDFDLSSLSLEEPGAAPSIDLSVAEPATKAVPPAPSLDLSDLSLDLDSPATAAAPAGDADSGGVATKLELAKAYVEIGDTDGAKEILLEVSREGSAAQQDEAKKILAGL
jgi:pilus assembly protein FimV